VIKKLEESGIGRPSTYSGFIDILKSRGYVKHTDIQGTEKQYKKIILTHPPDGSTPQITEKDESAVFGKEKDRLEIQPVGIICMDYLIRYFDEILQPEYTAEIERQMDEIANFQGELDNNPWAKYLCKLKEKIEQLAKNAPPLQKMTFPIDESNDFVFRKMELWIRRKVPEMTTIKPNKKTFTYEYFPIKKSTIIDMERIKRKDYTLDELLEYPNTVLGEYAGTPLKIKTGEYGHYLEWGTESHPHTKSLESLDKNISLFTLDQQHAIDFIEEKMKETAENADKKRVFRILDPFTDIRQGKYGTYIYHKTEEMKKPKFIPLKKCPHNYMTATAEELMKWVYKKMASL
jgi:DNA topoisomerase-1